jgi:hypothetical protein
MPWFEDCFMDGGSHAMSKTFLLSMCCCAALCGCQHTAPVEQDRPGASPETEPEPEHPAGGLTAMDQSNDAEDLRITQQIRQSLMADGALSFDAKNVKVITVNHGVVLRGPVKSSNERDAIAGYAHATAGVTRVDDLLEVPADTRPQPSPEARP